MTPGMRLQSASRAGSRNALDTCASEASVVESSSAATLSQMYAITSLENEREALYVAFCKFASVLVAKIPPPLARLPNP